ncbi:MAG: DUF4331 family protein [Pyrinomonadaceae bacterium]|nr:DUF4331 family protein [Pyrinomonadaceae bacterium]
MSHHFDNTEGREDGRVDLLDLYVFPGEQPDTTVFIMTVNPDAGLSSQTTFRGEGLYEFKIATNGDLIEDIVLRITFGEPETNNKTQPMSVRITTGGKAKSGTEGDILGEGRTNQVIALSNGGRAWAGLAADPFFADGEALARFLKSLLIEKRFDRQAFEAPSNFFNQRNVTGIVLEVPNAIFHSQKIDVWMTVSLYGHAPLIQVSRYGTPLMTHVFLQTTEHKDLFNQTHPQEDRTNFADLISSFVAQTVQTAKTSDDPAAYGQRIANTLLPNVMSYHVGTVASYDFDSRNGRALRDDVFDVVVTTLANTPLTDHVAATNRYQQHFPFLGEPYLEEEQKDLPKLIDR